jgi:hypothetical protein
MAGEQTDVVKDTQGSNLSGAAGGARGRRLQRDLAWPELPYEGWRDTLETLHRWTQIVGKLRLAQSPFEAEWQNVPLYVSARGLTTGPVPYGDIAFEAIFDFLDHDLILTTSDGDVRRLRLEPRAVSDFYRGVLDTLDQMGVSLEISDLEVEIPGGRPFSDDNQHTMYDPEPVRRFFRILSRVDQVLKGWRARFWGKATPVNFWWGSFDLGTARFSGRPAAPPPGSDVIFRYGMDAEEVTGGFWPGDARFPRAAFFAYAYPKPDGIERAEVRPAAAFWSRELGEFVLPYDDVRLAADPERAIVAFLDSVYEAAASLGGWDRHRLEVRDTPPPARRSPRAPATAG